MTHLYDCIDWDAEAQHLKMAFGVVGNCHWVSESNFWGSYLATQTFGKVLCVKSSGPPLMCSSGDRVEIPYKNSGLKFELYRFAEVYCRTVVKWGSKEPELWIQVGADASAMNGALYYMVMNSTAVAAAMNITAHDKIEWTLEFEA